MTTHPSQIGPYLTERLLGRGSMAAVYLCRAESGEPVAVKWLEQDHPPVIRRFMRECASLARIRHMGVVGWRGQGSHQGRPYLVMEYVEGTDLRILTPKLHERPPAERYARCRAVGVALCEALEALHAERLVHRDVKPSNVLQADDGRVLLTDLGVVKDLSDEECDRTATGLLVGTAAYAAPEQVEGTEVDARADQFGLGATLYYLLTQRRPFEDRSRTRPKPPSHLDPGVPEALEAVVMRLLALRPGERFGSMAEARLALQSGQDDGVRIAGRQEALSALASGLARASEGAKVLFRPQGTLGSGRGWIGELVERSAQRRGIPVLRAEENPEVLPEFFMRPAGRVALGPPDGEAPPGVQTVDLPLPPLGVAELRRTVVGAAPLTPDPARAAETLHRLTGGLPGLLVPLLSRHVQDGELRLPARPELPGDAEEHLAGLDPDEQDLLWALSLSPRALSVDELESVLPLSAAEPLIRLEQRGLLRRADSLWAVSAELFRAAALESCPDVPALRARIQAVLDRPQTETGPRLSEALVAREQGRLAQALRELRRIVARSAGEGDSAAECAALCALGETLLDLGRSAEARGVLADASALARVAEDPRLRRLAHALRAAGSLDEKPGNAGAAAAAIDRLLPMLAGAEARPGELPDALAYAVWSRAAATIGDRSSSRKSADQAEARRDGLSPDEAVRLDIALARAALQRGDKVGVRRILERAVEQAPAGGLRQWQASVLISRLESSPRPSPAPLLVDADPDLRLALERWV